MKAGPSSGKEGVQGQTDRRPGCRICEQGHFSAARCSAPVPPLSPLLPNLLLFPDRNVVEPPASGSPRYAQRRGLSPELDGAAGLQRKTRARPLKQRVAQVSSVTNAPCSLPWSFVKRLTAPVRQARRAPVLSASNRGLERGDAGALHT